MVVAAITWDLSIPGCASLKEKRGVIRSLKDRMIHRFHVSVAETGLNDVLTRAEVTAALVASDRRFAESVLDSLDRFVDSHGHAVVTGTRRTLY